jgi:hypothetical protein
MILIAHASLVSPQNLSFFSLCAFHDRRISLFDPLTNRRWLLLVSHFLWTLWSESPSLEVMPEGADRQLDVEALLDELTDDWTGP